MLQSPAEPARETAGVFVTRAVTSECTASRLSSLLSTSHRHVVLCESHPALSKQAPSGRLSASGSLEILDLKMRQRLPPAWRLFANPAISGWSKANFVLWLASSTTFVHAWHVEDDVLLSGRWHELFDQTDPRADLVATQVPYPRSWYWAASCRRPPLNGERLRCDSVGSPLSTWWPLLRMSRRLARAIRQTLNATDGYQGFHEALLEPLCSAIPWCITARLPALRGRYRTGHSQASPAVAVTGRSASLNISLSDRAALFALSLGRRRRRLSEHHPFDTHHLGVDRSGFLQIDHPVKCVESRLGRRQSPILHS